MLAGLTAEGGGDESDSLLCPWQGKARIAGFLQAIVPVVRLSSPIMVVCVVVSYCSMTVSPSWVFLDIRGM